MSLIEEINRIRKIMILEELNQTETWESIQKTIDILNNKKKLIITLKEFSICYVRL